MGGSKILPSLAPHHSSWSSTILKPHPPSLPPKIWNTKEQQTWQIGSNPAWNNFRDMISPPKRRHAEDDEGSEGWPSKRVRAEDSQNSGGLTEAEQDDHSQAVDNALALLGDPADPPIR
ncbi:MAG: hypothetical protein M1816_003115 [Peltula sp. TS41687]|nr:MAG: hypothetical protein M1816_003115 [Peltula sp. TS41687]